MVDPKAPAKRPIETFNKYLIGVVGDDITVMQSIPHRISKADALLLAAWLVALADDTGEDGTTSSFMDVLEAVQNT
jgi:hypothetical protein